MKKPKLYIIHGWTYTVDPWAHTIEALEEQGLSVEMLHVPGLTAGSKKVWTIEEYAHWADRNIPDGSVALGHSNGGRILLNLCAEKPDKLSHLILLDSAGIYETSSKKDVSRRLSKCFGFLRKIPGAEKIWHKLTGASDYDRAPANMKATLTNMLESDKKLDLKKIQVPTSILWGADDTITPPRHGERLHQEISGSTFELYQGWNHAPYIAKPGELARAILKVYKKPPQRESATAPAGPITQASSISASMALRKAAEPEIPDTAKVSAALAFKKAKPAGSKSASEQSIQGKPAEINFEQTPVEQKGPSA